jgi:TonB family protein
MEVHPMKDIIWLFPLAGALLGFAASYLAFYLKFRLVPACGYNRLNYRVIESFDMKAALFSTTVLMALAMGAAGGYPVIKNMLKPEPEENNHIFIPVDLDTFKITFPPPPPIDPKNKPEPWTPNLFNKPVPGSKIVLVPEDGPDTVKFDERTNTELLNSYARNANPANDSLTKYAVIDNSANLPKPEDYVVFSQAPAPLNVVRPVYPSICRTMGAEGRVFLQVLVDRNGKVAKVRVLKSSGNEALDEAALEALKGSTFSPALQGDKPVAVWISYPVTFSLSE